MHIIWVCYWIWWFHCSSYCSACKFDKRIVCAIETAAAQDACRAKFAAEWDEDENYIVYDELKPYFPGLTCEKISECCCLFTLEG